MFSEEIVQGENITKVFFNIKTPKEKQLNCT